VGSPAIKVSIEGYKELEALLVQIEKEMREKALKASLKAGGTVLKTAAKRKCPRGDEAHAPDKKPLNETIGIVMRGAGDKQYAVVGPLYPAGAHGHLVEYGHDKILWGRRTSDRVPPHPFLRPAFDESKQSIFAAMKKSLEGFLKRMMSRK